MRWFSLRVAIEIRTNCHVTKLVTVTEPYPVGERVVGVSYAHPEAGTVELRADAVVLTTGGFGFGQVSNSLLSKWTPWLDGMPTTNGSFATGEGVMMAEAAHAALVHMNQVQVHPTGFVDPSDPANPVKFLGASLCQFGVGALRKVAVACLCVSNSKQLLRPCVARAVFC
jgi:succinate dehydrogenase/fumarate reductase flavoprotein subunit